MSPLVYTYLVYILFAVTLTVWVARTLHRNDRIFLVDAFGGNEPLADSVNHLLVVGFSLISLGYITLTLTTYENPTDILGVLRTLGVKLGGVGLALGIVEFVILIILSRLRARRPQHPRPPAALNHRENHDHLRPLP